MQKWTYFVQTYTLTQLLNIDLLEDIGKQGWELASMLRLHTSVANPGGKECCQSAKWDTF